MSELLSKEFEAIHRSWYTEMPFRVMRFIQEYKEQRPYSPDLRDIMAGCGISSTSVVNYYLDRLEEYGLVSFLYVAAHGKRRRNRGSRTVHVTDKGRSFLEFISTMPDLKKPENKRSKNVQEIEVW